MTVAAASLVIPSLSSNEKSGSEIPRYCTNMCWGIIVVAFVLWMIVTVLDLHIVSLLIKVYSALGMATQHTVFGCVAALLLTRRDTGTLSLLIGICGNGVVAKILKRVINESRPTGSYLEGSGMPSGHTTSLFFIATSFVLILANPDCPRINWPVLHRVDSFHMQVVVIAYAIAMSMWRVQQGIHSLPQVAVGAVLGATNALLYYMFISSHVAEAIKSVTGRDVLPRSLLLCVCLVVTIGMMTL